MTTKTSRQNTPSPTPDSPSPTTHSSLWHNRNYLLWFNGDLASDLGNSIRTFAMPLIAYEVTSSLSTAGIIGAVGVVFTVVTMFPGGLFADRYDRKSILVCGHVYGIAVWAIGTALYFASALNEPALFLLAAGAGIRSGFFGAASNAAIKQLVRDDQLSSAVAANQAREATISVASGPIAGLLLTISLVAPFLAQLLGHLSAWLSTRMIRRSLDPRDGTQAPPWQSQLRATFLWLKSVPIIVIIIGVLSVTNVGLNGIFNTLLLSLRAADTAPTAIGFLSTAMGIGMIGGSLIAPFLVKRLPTGWITIAAITWAALWWGSAIVTTHLLAITIVFGLGAAGFPIANSALGGYMFAQIPNAQMGAIMAVVGILAMSLLPFAPLFAGLGLDFVGRTTTLIAFTILIVFSAAVLLITPRIRQLPRPDRW